MKKGYFSEYKTKQELIKKFGKLNVIKIAISQQGADFIVVSCGKIIKVIEVKECHKKDYYATRKEKNQFKRIIEFAKAHKIDAELWVYKLKGSGKPLIKETHILYNKNVQM